MILPLWRSGLQVDHKADESPVTEADRRGETLILARLAERFPDVPVISEEDASEFGTPDQIGARFFLVDPLDGTKAFVRGDEHWTVNIGLIQDGAPVAGAVSAPAWGRTWYTASGGARRRATDGSVDEPIHVRPWAGDDAVALISHTMKPEVEAELRALYGYGQVLAMDSSAKLCMVAEGSADIYPRHGTTMEWDIAAADAVLRAAGGRLTTPDGRAVPLWKGRPGLQERLVRGPRRLIASFDGTRRRLRAMVSGEDEPYALWETFMADSTLASLRRLWFNIHLWVGLILFVFLLALGLSGTALAWRPQLDRLLHPARYAGVAVRRAACRPPPICPPPPRPWGRTCMPPE